MPDQPSFRDPAVVPTQPPPGLRALLVDDEAPALSELAFLLRQDHRIGEIRTATSGADALRALETHSVDVVFCDIKMPGLDGDGVRARAGPVCGAPADRLRHRL